MQLRHVISPSWWLKLSTAQQWQPPAIFGSSLKFPLCALPSLKNKGSERGVLIDGQTPSVISTVKSFCLPSWLGPLDPNLLIGLITVPCFSWKVTWKQELLLCLCAFIYMKIRGSSCKGNESAGIAPVSDRREAHATDCRQHESLPSHANESFLLTWMHFELYNF